MAGTGVDAGNQFRLNEVYIFPMTIISFLLSTGIKPNRQPSQRRTPSAYQNRHLPIYITSSHTPDLMWVSICPYIP